MKKMTQLFSVSLTLIVFSLTVTFAQTPPATTPASPSAQKGPVPPAADDPIVATVDGVEIRLNQFMQAYNQNLLFVSGKKVTKERVLNDIIHREIGLKKARAEGLATNPIVKAKMDDVLYHAQISKDLEAKLAGINVTDKDAEDYYKNNKEIRTAHILLRLKVNPTKEEFDEVMKGALAIHFELKRKPEAWAELANKHSQATNAAQAGDMGFQPALNYAPEYYEAIKGKKVGYIAPPIQTQFGLHIVKVLGIKEWKDADPVLYKKIVYDQKRDKIMEQYFQELRKTAAIKINKQHLK